MRIDDLGKKFKTRVKFWSKKMQSFPYEVRLERMEKKWGYCTSDGVVGFNSELLFLSEEAQDFVIIHELLHLKVAKHGKLFNSLMSSYLPNWRAIERRLPLESRDIS